MLESLVDLDKRLFLFVNRSLVNPVFDWLCPWLRTQEIWYPVYALLAVFIILKYKKESWKILLAGVLLIVATDQFSGQLVKKTFERLRPCNDEYFREQVRLLVNCGRGYSFISVHATNHFALAAFISFYFVKYFRMVTVITMIWAFSIGFSQVYVGVHYPFDVIAGALTGLLFGYAFAKYSSKYVIAYG